MELLASIGVVGLMATGFGAIVRSLPWPAAALAKKPLNCALCVAFHSTWIVLAASMASGVTPPSAHGFAIVGLGSTGLATVLLAQTGMFVPPLDLGGA
jgi:hypothetical protein